MNVRVMEVRALGVQITFDCRRLQYKKIYLIKGRNIIADIKIKRIEGEYERSKKKAKTKIESDIQ